MKRLGVRKRAARARPIRGVMMACAVTAAAAACPALLTAQTVRGELVEEGLGAPIEGAFIVLLDERGEQVAAMLTNAAGRFVLHAPTPGRYTVRAERIGYENFTSPVLELASEQVLDHRLTMPVRPIELPMISVKGERQCNIRGSEGERVAVVWEEARKALSAAVWTEEQRRFRFTTRLWERLLDPRNLEILEEQAELKVGLATYPFRALPAEELAEIGYVRRFEGKNVTEYYAPDAQTLLSNLFLDDHCFRVVEGKGERRGMVGLAFEPARKKDKTDVSGVLWLSAQDAHLRHVEYRYENLPSRIRASDKLGGRLEFRMIPGGEWIVDDWYIRMPVTEVTFVGNPKPVLGSLRRLREKRKLVAIKEVGGAVIGLTAPGGRQVSQIGRGSLAGQVFDSTRSAALAGATVSLLGTNHRTTTGEDGRYSMEYLPPGSFFVTLSHPRVGMLRLGSALRPVVIQADQQVHLDLAIPSTRHLAPTLCPSMEGPEVGIVVGLVTESSTGERLQGAHVRLSTRQSEVSEPGSAGGAGTDGGFESVSDQNGSFLFCGVPIETELYARALLETEDGSTTSEVGSFMVANEEIYETHLEVPLPAERPEGR